MRSAVSNDQEFKQSADKDRSIIKQEVEQDGS
jgi:hypothetical protein